MNTRTAPTLERLQELRLATAAATSSHTSDQSALLESTGDHHPEVGEAAEHSHGGRDGERLVLLLEQEVPALDPERGGATDDTDQDLAEDDQDADESDVEHWCGTHSLGCSYRSLGTMVKLSIGHPERPLCFSSSCCLAVLNTPIALSPGLAWVRP